MDTPSQKSTEEKPSGVKSASTQKKRKQAPPLKRPTQQKKRKDRKVQQPHPPSLQPESFSPVGGFPENLDTSPPPYSNCSSSIVALREPPANYDFWNAAEPALLEAFVRFFQLLAPYHLLNPTFVENWANCQAALDHFRRNIVPLYVFPPPERIAAEKLRGPKHAISCGMVSRIADPRRILKAREDFASSDGNGALPILLVEPPKQVENTADLLKFHSVNFPLLRDEAKGEHVE
jgi:hypothetical protein